MLILMASIAVAGDECPEQEIPSPACQSDLSQDYNCNGIEAVDEEAIDLSDPLCQSQTDSDGNPWPNADYYVEYKSFGCLYPVADYDTDGCLLYTSPSPRDGRISRMPSSA